MAFAFVNKITADATNNGTPHSITTGSVNMTGADTFIVVIAIDAGAADPDVSDSPTNTYEKVIREADGGVDSAIYLAKGATPSSTQTFTVAVSNGFFSCVVYGFSGGHATSIIDQANSFRNTANSLQPGSVTPSENNELIVAGLANATTDTIAIDSGFSSVDQEPEIGGSHYGCAAAYKIQTSAGAENPEFSWTSNTVCAATIATFKSAAGGGVTLGRLILRTPA